MPKVLASGVPSVLVKCVLSGCVSADPVGHYELPIYDDDQHRQHGLIIKTYIDVLPVLWR